MNPDSFTLHVEKFFHRCVRVFAPKNKDYTPHNAALLDVFQTAYEEGVPPTTVLRVHLQKHWTAIRGWTIGQSLESEGIEGRLHDAANYIAMLHCLSVVPIRDEIFAGIARVKGLSCACGCVAEAIAGFRPDQQLCEHGKLLRWLMTFATTLDSRPESWPMTRRALGSFLMDPNPIGDISPPVPSPLRTATPRDTPPTSATK